MPPMSRACPICDQGIKDPSPETEKHFQQPVSAYFPIPPEIGFNDLLLFWITQGFERVSANTEAAVVREVVQRLRDREPISYRDSYQDLISKLQLFDARCFAADSLPLMRKCFDIIQAKLAHTLPATTELSLAG